MKYFFQAILILSVCLNIFFLWGFLKDKVYLSGFSDGEKHGFHSAVSQAINEIEKNGSVDFYDAAGKKLKLVQSTK